MRSKHCTAFRPGGRQAGRCGRFDRCALVEVWSAGKRNIRRWVCGRCRARLGYPDAAILIERTGTDRLVQVERHGQWVDAYTIDDIASGVNESGTWQTLSCTWVAKFDADEVMGEARYWRVVHPPKDSPDGRQASEATVHEGAPVGFGWDAWPAFHLEAIAEQEQP